MAANQSEATASTLFRRGVGIPFLLLSLLIIATTAGAIAYTFNSQEKTELARLKTIAGLKAEQISDWLAERQQEAEFIQSSPYYAEQYQQWRSTGDEKSKDQLLARLSRISNDWGVNGVMLHDSPGSHLWASNGELHPTEQQRQAEEASVKDGKIRRVGPYQDNEGNPHLDFVIPMIHAAEPTPLIILHIDLSLALHDTLKNWSVPSESSDTMLLRYEDGKIMFLHSHHQPRGDTTELHSIHADDNQITSRIFNRQFHNSTVITGLDYRNVPVMGVVHTVAGTDWLVLAKIDRSELYAEAVKDSAWIILAGLLALFMTTVSLIMIRQSQQLTVADSIRQAQADRIRALNLLSAIADGSSDAIYAKDLDGKYLLFNRAASEIVGRSSDEVVGMDDSSIFPAEQAENIMQWDRKAIAEQLYSTLEESLNTTAGSRTFLTTKGPLYDPGGTVIGTFGISRDITERKQAEIALIERDNLLQEMSAIAHVGGWWFDPETGEGNWTDEVARIHGVDPRSSVSTDFGLHFFHGEYRQKIEDAVNEACTKGTPYDLELELISASGEVKLGLQLLVQHLH